MKLPSGWNVADQISCKLYDFFSTKLHYTIVSTHITLFVKILVIYNSYKISEYFVTMVTIETWSMEAITQNVFFWNISVCSTLTKMILVSISMFSWVGIPFLGLFFTLCLNVSLYFNKYFFNSWKQLFVFKNLTKTCNILPNDSVFFWYMITVEYVYISNW